VYRARDTRLKRDVDRLARFGREARVLASLNHLNVAAIYGLDDGPLVLELVEGETGVHASRSRSLSRRACPQLD
jgi:serine/threonine-protein kinase